MYDYTAHQTDIRDNKTDSEGIKLKQYCRTTDKTILNKELAHENTTCETTEMEGKV